jgi:hypothetical protein
MRSHAYKAQIDWVFVDDRVRDGQIELADQSQRALVAQFRARMLGMTVPKPYRDPTWVSTWLSAE